MSHSGRSPGSVKISEMKISNKPPSILNCLFAKDSIHKKREPAGSLFLYLVVKGGFDSDRLWAIFALRAPCVRPKSLSRFCEPPGVVLIDSQPNKKRPTRGRFLCLVVKGGFEPPTYGL
jgi:hypothetical protein